MWRLAIVQFFSWFSLFLMWVYTTSGVAQNVWSTVATDSTSAAFNEAGNWVGVIFAAYSLFAALFSLVMAQIANRIGRKSTYMISLLLGGAGLISMIPVQWKSYAFKIMFRKNLLKITVNQKDIQIENQSEKDIEIIVFDKIYLINGNGNIVVAGIS